jgi:hypothetical protein
MLYFLYIGLVVPCISSIVCSLMGSGVTELIVESHYFNKVFQ